MNRRDIVIGIIILLLLGGAIYLSQRGRNEELVIPEEPSIEDKIEESFDIEIPEDVEKSELRDVTGGSASAIATRKYENGTFGHSILADLPDTESGEFYQGWLVRGEEGDEDFSFILTGTMSLAKGGWMLNFQSSSDYSNYNKVVVTLEKTLDANPEQHILEGSF